MITKFLIFLLVVFSFIVKVSGQGKLVLDSFIIEFKIAYYDTVIYNNLVSIDSVLSQSDKDSAIQHWSELIIYSENSGNVLKEAYCYFFRGKEYNSKGDYFNGYNDYLKSIELFTTIDYKWGLARAYNALGILNSNVNRHNLAFENLLKSAKLFGELNKSSSEGQIYLNLGGTLTELIDTLTLNKDTIKQTIGYLQKSISILGIKKDFNLLHAYINLGELYFKIKNYDSAYYYLEKSYGLSKSAGHNDDKFQAVFHYAEFLLTHKTLYEAEPIVLEALEIWKKNYTFNTLPVEDCENFSILVSNYYSKKGDWKLAFDFLSETNKYRFKSSSEKSALKINGLEFEKLQEKSRFDNIKWIWTLSISIAVSIILLLIIFTTYKNYRAKQKANQLLTELDELKSRYFSDITHELRTPLTLILSPLEQMLSSETDKIPDKKQVKMMRKNANQILSLVNQMLDLSKIEAKNVKLELVEDDLNKFLRIHFAAFLSVASQKSIDYHYSLLKEKNLTIFDASKLEKIINNLVSNAIKYTRKNGSVNCKVHYPKENILQIEVSDTGIGIPKNQLENIFKRYHRISSEENMNTVGTGIGLSLTSELVSILHGTIKVESEPDVGSKFTVQLPLGIKHLKEDEYELISKNSITVNHSEPVNTGFEIEADAEDNTENITASPQENNLPLVLIVEDNKDICDYIADNLNDHYRIKIAHNGAAGLKKAVETIPDLVISDVVMPKMDGIAMCAGLKTDENTSHIPVIILSGKSAIEDRIEALETGADAYLAKPFNVSELKHLVNNLIEQRRKLRERFTRNLKLEPKEIAITSADEKFITRALEVIEKNIGNPDFEVNQFQEEMFMSRMQLFRKIKALTNQTPGDFIRTIRLKRAAELIKQNFGNIAQITYEVGFNNPSYFAKCFKELYGVLPSDYHRQKN